MTLSWLAGELPSRQDAEPYPYSDPEFYAVTVSGPDQSRVITSRETHVQVSGLRNGVTYTFQVFAVTADGRSAGSELATAIPKAGTQGVIAGLIVQYEEGVAPFDLNGQPVAADAGEVTRIGSQRALGGDLHAVALDESVSLAQALEIASDLTADPRIATAEPDYLVGISTFPDETPNDPGYADQWNLWGDYGVGIGSDVNSMTNTLSTTQGNDSVVAIIDTGIVDHPDLAGALLPGFDFVSNPSELAAPREEGAQPSAFDADADDTARFGSPGWDDNPQDPGDWRGIAPVRGSTWHGTGIAGVIAARADNAEGVVGIAPQAKVVPVRAISWRGGLLSDVAAGITWSSGGDVPGVPVNTNPADVINLSFAVQASCPRVLQEAIDAAVGRGAAVVAAAGNAGQDVSGFAPANCQNVIAVGATDQQGRLASYSNRGAGIDLVAPGGAGAGAIRTTSNVGARTPETPDYRFVEGTSIAAAHVSGALALAHANETSVSGARLVEPLLSRGVRALPTENCAFGACGAGLLDARSLVQISAVTVTMPTSFTATASTATLLSSSGTTPSVAGFSGSVLITVQAPTGTTVRVTETTGLSTVTGYQSPVSAAAQSIAFTGTQTAVNNALATLTYTGSATRPYITMAATLAGAAYNPENGRYYEAVSAPGGIGWVAARTAAAGRTFNGLTGYLAVITSASENEFISSKLSNDGWIGATDDPAITLLSEGRWKWVVGPPAEQLEFWSGGASGSGGSPVAGRYANWNSGEPNNYPFHADCGSEDYAQIYFATNRGKWNDLPCDRSSVGKLTSYVVEYGGAGGSATEQGTGYTNSAAGPPTNVTGISGNDSVDLSWTAPTLTGQTLTSYTATATPGGATCQPSPLTATSCTITGLTNGTSYTFSVSATYSVAGGGSSSDSSAASSPVIPGVPGAPTSVTATAGDARASVSWTAPTNPGSSAITSYTVTASPGGVACTTPSGAVTTCSVTGLSNGTSYTFSVFATNAFGSGPTSSASSAVTPSASGGGGGGSPEPTAEPTPTPTPTPTSTAEPTAEPTTTPTASASPQPTPTRSPKPTKSPSPQSAESAAAASAADDPVVVDEELAEEPVVQEEVVVVEEVTPSPSPSPSGSEPTTQPSVTGDAPPAPAFDAQPAPGQSLLTDETLVGPVMNLRVDLQIGASVTGRSAIVEAAGLQPGSPVQVLLFSEPQVIGSAVADDVGNAIVQTVIPDGLPPGQHTIMAVGTGPNGQPVQSVGAFDIDGGDIVTAVSPPAQLSEPIDPDDPQIARALAAGKPMYDIALFPAVIASVAVAGAAFVGLAGMGGLTNNSEGGQRSSRGKLAGVVTKKLKAAGGSEPGAGDRSRTWAMPGTRRTDAWIKALPLKAGKISALVPRVLVDGAWSRAMFGSFGFFLWIVGLALGLMSAWSTGFQALPPALPLMLAIIALGILDSAAGAIAWLTITIAALVTGHLTTLPELRTVLGLFVLFASVPLLAHVIRPLRRMLSGDSKDLFDRFADYVMPPVFLAFAAISMFKALNGLSGLELVSKEDFGEVGLVVAGAFLVRMAMEDIAMHAYPIRSTEVQPAKLTSPGRSLALASVAVRIGIFLVIAVPFFGLGWATYLSALLIAIPMVLKVFEDDLPNSVFINKWFPRGVARFAMLLVIGIYVSFWLLGQEASDEQVRQTYNFILLPGIIFGIIELVGREGFNWPNSWIKRIAGFFFWIFAIGIVTGFIALT